jgi:hypothetical protein
VSRRAVAAVAFGGATSVGVSLYLVAGTILTAPTQHAVRPPPKRLNPETIVLASPSGAQLAAWVFVPPSPRGAVAVVHGVRADRSAMLSRARLMWDAGFAVLVPDLPGARRVLG